MSEERKLVLVLGWYGHGNLGDEAFRASFPELWPGADFVFADCVPDDVNDAYEACMVGGGSFLDTGMPGIERVAIPLAFVGVGVGKRIRPEMLAALERAKAIVVRDKASYEALREHLKRATVLARVYVAADLVWARPAWPEPKPEAIGVTVILSEHFVPRGETPEWVAASWTWFCRELAQVLDKLIDEGGRVRFLSMSTTRTWDDRRAAGAVISRMKRAADALWYRRYADEGELLEMIASSKLVISQRLHGAIFAAAIGCPVVPVIGHDKMRGLAAELGLSGFDYYALSAATIEAAVRQAMAGEGGRATSYRSGALERWRVASGVVERELSL